MQLYTSVFGGFDNLRPLPPGITGVCFCDGAVTPAQGWELRIVEPVCADTRRASRYHKIMSHVAFPGETTMYMDGDHQFIAYPPEVEYGGFWHIGHVPAITSTADEVAFFLKSGRKKLTAQYACAKAQLATYTQAGFPDSDGHTANGVIVRMDTPAVRRFNTLWWEAYMAGCTRDQVSSDYARWRAGIVFTALCGSYRKNAYAVKRGHIDRRA